MSFSPHRLKSQIRIPVIVAVTILRAASSAFSLEVDTSLLNAIKLQGPPKWRSEVAHLVKNPSKYEYQLTVTSNNKPIRHFTRTYTHYPSRNCKLLSSEETDGASVIVLNENECFSVYREVDNQYRIASLTSANDESVRKKFMDTYHLEPTVFCNWRPTFLLDTDFCEITACAITERNNADVAELSFRVIGETCTPDSAYPREFETAPPANVSGTFYLDPESEWDIVAVEWKLPNGLLITGDVSHDDAGAVLHTYKIANGDELIVERKYKITRSAAPEFNPELFQLSHYGIDNMTAKHLNNSTKYVLIFNVLLILAICLRLIPYVYNKVKSRQTNK